MGHFITRLLMQFFMTVCTYRSASPTVGSPPRADCIRVYGMLPRHWMPAYASMTIKRSFPRKRESRIGAPCYHRRLPLDKLLSAAYRVHALGMSGALPRRVANDL